MDGQRRCILLAVLIMGSIGPVIAQEAASAPVSPATDPEVDKQVRIYKTTLLEGKDEQTRLDAASLLLFNGNGEARKELLDVLRDPGHPDGRAAVCRALVNAREDRKPVSHKEEFIEPLIGVLSTETNPSRADQAAQALLMFSYGDIQTQLERLVDDSGGAKTARFNAVRALKYQPDDRAIFKLIALLGDQEAEVAGESKKALELLGFTVPTDPNAVQVMAEGVRQRGPEAYLKNPLIMRNWLVSRESRIRELTASVASWEQKYLTALGTLYDGLADENGKSEFLLRQLNAPEPTVKLWALGKLEELRKGTSKGKLSPELEKAVLGLVSHRDRRVRLKTAGLLTLTWELDSTKQLLAQLQVEEDSEVRHGLFVALGNACYYASLPTSSVKVPDAVRKQTLELAVGFLNQADPQRTRSGADVVRKLLEQDGLAAEDIRKYLMALAQRYEQVGPTANHGLRGELLSAMAVLCAEQSVVRTQAATLYGPVFESALADAVEPVRQAAVEGLINIDKAAALKRLRADFSRDSSAAIRARLVDLAGDIGGQEDLDWLSKKLGAGNEAGPAWQAMLKILRRSNTDVMANWTSRFETMVAPNGLTAEQMTSCLALLEQKARGENKPDKLREARMKLFGLYAAANDVPRATEYVKLVLDAAANEQEKVAVASELLDVCLKSGGGQTELAGALVEKYLSEKDLGPDHPLAKSIGAFLEKPPAGVDPNALLLKLRQIKVKEPEKRTLWRKLLVQWEAFAKASKHTPPDKANN